MDKSRMTDRVLRAIDLARKDAREIGDNFIGAEHLVLGLIDVYDDPHDSQLGMALRELGADISQLRAAVLRVMGKTDPREALAEAAS